MNVKLSEGPAMLLVLPVELLLKVGLRLLADDLPSALRLRSVCTAARARMQQVQAEAEARRLCWDVTTTTVGPRHYMISGDGHTLGLNAYDGNRNLHNTLGCDQAWATSYPLPARRSSFKFHLAGAWQDQKPYTICLGVCDYFSRCAWSLDLSSGKLVRFTGYAATHYCKYGQLPHWHAAGFPTDRDERTQVIPEWPPPQAQADGVMVQCILDDGELSFRINDGKTYLALSGFPVGAQMRPWASLSYEAVLPHSFVTVRFYD